MCLSPPSHVFQPSPLLPRLSTPVHLSPVVSLLLCVLVPCVCLCPLSPSLVCPLSPSLVCVSAPYPPLSCFSVLIPSLVSLIPLLSCMSLSLIPLLSLSLIPLSCVFLCPLSPSLVCVSVPYPPLSCFSVLIPFSRVSLSLIPLSRVSPLLSCMSPYPPLLCPHPTPSCVFMNPSCVSPVGPRRYDREYLLQFRNKGECQAPPQELLNKDCYKKK